MQIIRSLIKQYDTFYSQIALRSTVKWQKKLKRYVNNVKKLKITKNINSSDKVGNIFILKSLGFWRIMLM